MTDERPGIVKVIPAAVGGWNARDPLAAMPETDAIRMVNVFPDLTSIRKRNGHREHSTGMGTGTVSTLGVLRLQSGTQKLIACANNKIYDASTYNASATDISNATAITNNYWSTINFRNRIFMVNGSDAPRDWDGVAGTVSDTGWTGTTIANLIQVTSYKNRLYFVEKNSCKVWYTSTVDAITGALNSFDFQSVFQLGGYVMFAASSTRQTAGTDGEFFIVMSSEGEILVYQGTDPADSTTPWRIIARYAIAPPLGRRAYFYLGSDLYFITAQGVFSMTDIAGHDGDNSTAGFYHSLTDKIYSAFADASQNYRTNTGWEGFFYPIGRWIHINVPISNGVQYDQYGFNAISKSPYQFQGLNGACWALFNQKPYFGGINGKVYEADITDNDNGSAIIVDCKQAFNYCDSPETNKLFTLVQPLITGSAQIVIGLAVDVDYEDISFDQSLSFESDQGDAYDVAEYDQDYYALSNISYKPVQAVKGLGRCASIKFKGSLLNTQIAVNAFHLLYKPSLQGVLT